VSRGRELSPFVTSAASDCRGNRLLLRFTVTQAREPRSDDRSGSARTLSEGGDDLDLETVIIALQDVPMWAAYLALFAGAFGEYVFPPVPGDLIVVAGAVLVAVLGWPVLPVFLLVTLGAVLGAVVDYGVGRWIDNTGRLEGLAPKKQKAIALLRDRFARYGAAYLVVNRFLPGIRGFFFVAAGIARLKLGAVALYATLGAVAWNVLLFGLGYGLGRNLETLERVIVRHGTVMGIVVAIVLSVVAYRTWRAVNEEEPGQA
jgi:membrane protein DedA with SNARE-associated domain